MAVHHDFLDSDAMKAGMVPVLVCALSVQH